MPKSPKSEDEKLKQATLIFFKSAFRKSVKSLSNFNLAIFELGLLAGGSVLGTQLPQNNARSYYIDTYATDKLFGSLDGNAILTLGLDHVYQHPLFLSLLFILAFSLMACSSSTQYPLFKVARKWKFINNPAKMSNVGNYEILPDAKVADLGLLLRDEGMQIQIKDGKMYAFKGLLARIAPIGVHIAMLAIMGGSFLGQVVNSDGSVMVPEKSSIVIGDSSKGMSPLAYRPSGMKDLLTVDKFFVDFDNKGDVKVYTTDLTVRKPDGQLVGQKTIRSNVVMYADGIRITQGQWGIHAIKVRYSGSKVAPKDGKPLLLQAKPIKYDQLSGNLYGAYLPTDFQKAFGERPPGLSLVMKDPYNCFIYGENGEFLAVREAGSGNPLKLKNGILVYVDKIVATSGIVLQTDYTIGIVWTGIGLLLLTILASYGDHEQVWAFQNGNDVHVAYSSHRYAESLQLKMSTILNQVPDLLQFARAGSSAVEEAGLEDGLVVAGLAGKVGEKGKLPQSSLIVQQFLIQQEALKRLASDDQVEAADIGKKKQQTQGAFPRLSRKQPKKKDVEFKDTF